ncbi:MAG: alpha/beta family hydrolase [Acetobacteraceae bacterium]
MAEDALGLPLWYLPGASYPGDLAVEAALLPRLTTLGCSTVRSYQSLLSGRGPPAAWNSVEARLALLDTAAPADRSSLVLIGRSAGAVAATRFAAVNRIAAVVCLAYPFRHPMLLDDPGRFAHLRRLATPTLIVQGRNDPYGGIGIVEHYPLSPSIRLVFGEVGHDLAMPTEAWDDLATQIVGFLRDRHRVAPFHGLSFDEAFYRETHHDVAAALDAGSIGSGAEHYTLHGRAEGRRFRLMASPPPAKRTS